MDRIGKNVAVNATILDKSGKVIAIVDKNKTHVNTRNAFQWLRPDPHTIDVIDEFNHHVLYLRFLNPQTIQIKGYLSNSAGMTPDRYRTGAERHS